MIQSRDGVTRLWETCSLPDYRKVAPHAHAELVGQIFGFVQKKGAIPEDWFQRQVNLCDRIDGDIDTLAARIAQIRTWTFCANRDWLEHPLHWQSETRAIEDKLSDALHEKLTARFVDRRTSMLMRRLRENVMLEADVTAAGEVTVEGQPVGRLQGFRFTPEAGATGAEAKALSAAALKALASEIEARAEKLSAAPDEAFALALDGTIRWIGEPVAKLQAGEKVLEPRFVILADEQLTGAARDNVDARLIFWLKAHVRKLLGPLLTLETGEGLEGISRGIAYQLAESLGVLDRAAVQSDVKALDQEARGALRKLGVRFGAYHITTPLLLKPAPRALSAQLWALKHGGVEIKGLDDIAHLASSGRTSFPADETIPKPLYRVAGFRVCGPRAIRVDILERLADLIRPAIAFKPGQTPGEPPPGAFLGDGFTVTGGMTSLAGCAGEDFAAVLKGLGYRMEKRPPMKDVPVIPLVIAVAEPLASVAAESAPVEAAPAEDAPVEAAAAEDAPADSAPVAEAQLEPPAEPPVESAALMETVEAVAETPSVADAAAETPAVMEADVPAEGVTEAVEAAAPPAEPEMVDVWRPARFDRDQRPNRDRNRGRHRRDGQKPEGVAAPAVGETGERPQQRHGGSRKPWQKRDGKEGDRAPGKDGGGRRFEGKRDDKRRDGGERPDGPRRDRDRPRSGDKRPMNFSTEKQRDRQPDPNSPFAQLAALKAQLEGKT
jgi:ATP-dependent RNA helicase SUPV3L1/SUV3